MGQLKMTRDARPTAEAVFPEGYYMRNFQPGDEASWCACCIDGSLGVTECNAEQFNKIMTTESRVKPENIYFLISPDGDVAGTATFQFGNAEDEGYLHMVGLDKRYWGKKLSLPLVNYVVNKIIEGGKSSIFLTTDDWRLAAIKSYFNADFVPVINDGDEEMIRRWADVTNKLNL